MKIFKARMGFKKGILIVALIFSLIVFWPSVCRVAPLPESPSKGGSGGSAALELTIPEDLGLGALGVLGIVVVAQALDDGDTGGVPAQGAHGADGEH